MASICGMISPGTVSGQGQSDLLHFVDEQQPLEFYEIVVDVSLVQPVRQPSQESEEEPVCRWSAHGFRWRDG